MLLFDTMMVSGLRWVLSTLAQAALAEMDDDTGLREALVEAAERLALGEISEEEFAQVEEDVLAGIRAIRARREGASAAPISLVASLQEDPGESLEVQACITGDFHEPSPPPAHPPARVARPRRRGAVRRRAPAAGRRA